MNDHEAAAAEIAGARIGDRHRKADRDRGIDRIAAARQHVGADAGRAAFLRDHHAVSGGDRLRGRDAGPGGFELRARLRQRDNAAGQQRAEQGEGAEGRADHGDVSLSQARAG